MNVFSLFEMEDAESIKLGIQVIKTLGYQKEFETHTKMVFVEYEKFFNDYSSITFNATCPLSLILDSNESNDTNLEYRLRLKFKYDIGEIAMLLLRNRHYEFKLGLLGIYVTFDNHKKLMKSKSISSNPINIIENYFKI